MTFLRNVVSCVLIVAGVFSGCASLDGDRTREAMARLRTSSLMYLKPGFYESIYVEVETTEEGAKPTEDELKEIAQFLERLCRKPVTLHVKKALPAIRTEGLSATVVATQNMEGLPQNTGQPPMAYIYILFFNKLAKRTEGAYVNDYYPSAVIVTMSGQGSSGRIFLPDVVKHELGHILGLCSNESHGDGAHCDNKCLMREDAKVGWGNAWIRSVMGMDPRRDAPIGLCNDCEQDLRDTAQSQTDSTTEFHGPFFIRKEKGYVVASLPSHLHLGVGSTMDIIREAVLTQAKKMSAQLSPLNRGAFSTSYSYTYDKKDRTQLKKQRLAVEMALKDRDNRVVKLARQVKEAMDAQSRSSSQPATSQPSAGER